MRYHWLIPLTLMLQPTLGHAFALANDPAARVNKARASHAPVVIQPIPATKRGGVSSQIRKPSRLGDPGSGTDESATTDKKRRRTFHAR